MRYYDAENVLLIDDGPVSSKPPEHDGEPAEHGHELVVIETPPLKSWAGPIHGQTLTRTESRRGRHFAIHRHQ